MHVLPWCGGVVLAIIIITPCIIALCRKQCLQCYIKINREGVVAVSLHKKINLDCLLEGVQPPTPHEDFVGSGPPAISYPSKCENWWNFWKMIILYISCSRETRKEREARNKLSQLKSLLQRNRQNHTSSLQDCPPEEDKF